MKNTLTSNQIHIWRSSRTDKIRPAQVLSRYLDYPANQIKFSKSKHGKPKLAKPRVKIYFNLSHSYQENLFALTATSAVGIDIEKHRKNIDRIKVSRRFFSKDLAEKVQHLSEAASIKLFFKAWTFYEAFLKAKGLSIFSGRKYKNKFNAKTFKKKSMLLLNFKIQEIKISKNYSAAIASQVKNTKIKFFKI
ncbi:MAG: 4'-phosphopantetheinyl transferase superfamily protein [Deltaproteobacteria bacterium]|nr:4'-phosphopantetheinyl transferase superfamily protein [Deltaproteobacteria bacterium]